MRRKLTPLRGRNKIDMEFYVKTHIGSLLILLFILAPSATYFVAKFLEWTFFDSVVDLRKLFVSFIVACTSMAFYLYVNKFHEN